MSECLPDSPRYIRKRGGSWQGADHQNGPWRSIAAPQSGLPCPTDGPAAPESREPASVAPEATGQPRQLSPAAQAVLDAVTAELDWDARYHSHSAAAAALRAVADQVVPEPPDCGTASSDYNKGAEDRQELIRFRLLAIVAELEGADG